MTKLCYSALMLTLLQTGDLHLGKIFYEHSLIEDQAFMLDALYKELTENAYDALLISGDIYDRSVPPPEAVSLFDDFLTRVHGACPSLCICIISGNHDSSKRLAFGCELFKSHNIHICTEAEKCTRPVFLKNADGQTEAALYALPFLHGASLQTEQGSPLRNQEDLIKEAVFRIKNAHRELRASRKDFEQLPALLLCHVFTTGAQSGGSERIFAGTAELTEADVFSFFTYTAAGHIHKTQKIRDNLWYAGSPLAYSFDEGISVRFEQKDTKTQERSVKTGTQKNFLRIELDFTKAACRPVVEPIPVRPLRNVVKIYAGFEDIFRGKLYDDYVNDYIEFNYTDSCIIENAASRLRERFPFLLSVKKAAELIQPAFQTESEYKKRLLENTDSLSLHDILYAFLQDAGLIPASADSGYKSAVKAWKAEAELFVETEKEAHTHETA
ncbi:exonuclease subunit SbcD [Treponema sp. HNW]|uniref:metallophosphoesterase family protein n=1 Tax=Treponema sp. HNW TaxID=3116654 RepID=UPI003D09CF0C